MRTKALRLFPALFLMLAIAWPFAGAGEVRTWTSTDGRTLEAEFITANERNVTLRRKLDRKRFTLSLDKISESDRKWVAETLEDLDGPGERSLAGFSRAACQKNGRRWTMRASSFVFTAKKE